MSTSNEPNKPLSCNSVKRFLFKGSDIRGEILSLDSSFLEACNGQKLESTLRPMFGEFVAGVCLISEMLKFDGVITLQARGEGPVNILMSEATNAGHFRGIAQASSGASLDLSSEDSRSISKLLGSGVLAITLDPASGQRYQGIVPLDGETLADCLGHYFEQSEQIPTFFLLFANEKQCGGLLLQCLPAQEVTDPEQRAEQWSTIKQLATSLKADEFFATDQDTLLFRLFHEMECETFQSKPLSFQCSCSRERSENAIISLGKSEINTIIDEGKDLELNCHLCGAEYVFSVEDIQGLANRADTIH